MGHFTTTSDLSKTITKRSRAEKMHMNKKAYQICTRCIMDTSDPGITFDENGVCCYCKFYDQRVATEVFRGKDGEDRLRIKIGRAHV